MRKGGREGVLKRRERAQERDCADQSEREYVYEREKIRASARARK